MMRWIGRRYKPLMLAIMGSVLLLEILLGTKMIFPNDPYTRLFWNLALPGMALPMGLFLFVCALYAGPPYDATKGGER